MIKTRTWILLLSLLLLLCVGAAVLLFFPASQSQTVQVLQDGRCLYEIDLADVRQPYTLTVEDGHGGSNVLQIEPGRIRILSSDCPDQICVRRSWLDLQSAPIVCLPHRLVIQAVDGELP